MKGHRSRAALRERDLSEVGSRAAETITDLAEHALAAAKEVGHVASPALGRALERAAETLAESGEKLAKTGEAQAAEAASAARVRLADASEKLAEAIRPRKKHHRVRNVAIALVVVGGVVALVQSPLRAKLTQRLFGPPPDDEPESITLPGANAQPAEHSAPEEFQPPLSAAQQQGNGVPSTPAGAVDTTPS